MKYVIILIVAWLGAACTQNKNKTTAQPSLNAPLAKLPFYNTPNFLPIILNTQQDVNAQITHKVGAFSFTNHLGQTITEKYIDNKVHVANFIFTTCGSICPTMTDNMKRVASQYKNSSDVEILSFTVTPWLDDVPTLNKYKTQKEIDNTNWQFLTGSKAAIYDLARKSYFAEEDIGFTKDSTEFLHTEHFILVDKHQRLRGIYNGTLPLEADLLAKDIALLLKEE
jgi:protein SCO1